MKNFLKIAEGIDVMPLLLAIQRKSHLWQEDTFLRHYPQAPFGEMDTIFLRFPKRYDFGDDVEKRELYKQNMLPGIDQHESIDYPAYAELPEARALITSLMARLGGTRLGRCMVNRLMPGGQIFPHADTPEHVNYWNNRMHIVLQSEPGNVFKCGDEQVWMRQGEVWWFDHGEVHHVLNNSASERIHLIVDIRT